MVISTPNGDSDVAKTIFIENSESEQCFKAKKVTFRWILREIAKSDFLDSFWSGNNQPKMKIRMSYVDLGFFQNLLNFLRNSIGFWPMPSPPCRPTAKPAAGEAG